MGNFSILAAFGAGIASFLSPCVAPLLPGYLTMLSGNAQAAEAQSDRFRLFWPSLLFVLGFGLVFTTLGASASVFGDALQSHRQLLMRISGVIMILMGVAILWGSRFAFALRERRFHPTRQSFTKSETLLMGMAFGFGWTPCFGPILASILVYASLTDTVRQATLMLAAYSLGLGLPFLAAGIGLSQVKQLTRALTKYSQPIAVVSGLVLMVMGVAFLSGQMYRFALLTDRWFAV